MTLLPTQLISVLLKDFGKIQPAVKAKTRQNQTQRFWKSSGGKSKRALNRQTLENSGIKHNASLLIDSGEVMSGSGCR